uniref:Lipoxygenase domain-containing protein n=1 Tax=Knipowitschia caucasica TaxID=637954 RepID=A0AAV2LY12_KNICA
MFWWRSNIITEYVADHWKEDKFFGSQFLNGFNPTVIRRCQQLPSNFPVTNEMVQPFLDAGDSLRSALETGKIFMYDAKHFERIPKRIPDEGILHVAPGLCLFYLNSEQQMKPIAIQLYQQPAEDNPIFLPSDLESDWLLAKMFINNTVVMQHQFVVHLLKTHLLAEVYALSMLRNLPTVHPIHKILTPHFQGTIAVNTKARCNLIVKLFELTAVGTKGALELMKRFHQEITYTDLCLPDNITSRGLDDVPKFYYKEDGLKIWSSLNRNKK